MKKLCRQVSIESPGAVVKDCVFSFTVPVPDTPIGGVRVRVVCAGACYVSRRSLSSCDDSVSLAHPGVRDSALFAGFEVAGVVTDVAEGVEKAPSIGERCCIYPFAGCPRGYAEFVAVPDPAYVVPIPATIPLSLAAMLPSGGLRAFNTITIAQRHHKAAKVLVVGTGGLALWTVRVAKCIAPELTLTVASLRDEGLQLAASSGVTVVQWDEDLYERYLIERTVDACEGEVDVVIDYGTTSRSLHRSLQCLAAGGMVLLSDEVAERLIPKFSAKAREKQQSIEAVEIGSVEQLRHLVDLVATERLKPPPHTVFSIDEASEVVSRLSNSDIPGRAILRFHDVD
ncbi:uncharacterized protein LOC132257058 [Phlebotomus argentipes]|uniref:uncharacterized protein LOC132257058 n=1 Tax=Phlebotomus argentipes TaxID=94469 RepID=UPI002893472F|nr:uncharacterized protein LOC132257058 [Phlebotomus argentipes]